MTSSSAPSSGSSASSPAPASSAVLPPWKNYLDVVPADGLDARLRSHLETASRIFTELASKPAATADHAYAPGKWTVREVLGHILVTQRIFTTRAVCIARGETQALPGYDEGVYAANWPSVSLAALAGAYAVEAASTAWWMSLLGAEERAREGIANNTRVTPDQLMRALIGHELHHFSVLRERYGLDITA
jgi:uncharacterized damage-inducible protein DinB